VSDVSHDPEGLFWVLGQPWWRRSQVLNHSSPPVVYQGSRLEDNQTVTFTYTVSTDDFGFLSV
jgi:hypothetical protein